MRARREIEEIQFAKTVRIEKDTFRKSRDLNNPKRSYGNYTVVKGDALSKIAKKFGLKNKSTCRAQWI